MPARLTTTAAAASSVRHLVDQELDRAIARRARRRGDAAAAAGQVHHLQRADQQRRRGGDKSIQAQGAGAAASRDHERHVALEAEPLDGGAGIGVQDLLPHRIASHDRFPTREVRDRRRQAHRNRVGEWHQQAVREPRFDVLLVDERAGAGQAGGEHGRHGAEATGREGDMRTEASRHAGSA